MSSPALLGGQRYLRYPTTPYVATPTGNASANVKGSYVEIAASTSFAASRIRVTLQCGAANMDGFVDIAIGAAASEQIIISNLPISSITGRLVNYEIPIFIPAGARISARSQGTTGGQAVYVQIEICAGSVISTSSLTRCTTYGANTTDSGGVSVDPGGVANTKGAYTEIIAATTAPINWLILCIGGQVNTTRATGFWAADLAIGGSGSEQIIVPDIGFAAQAASDNIDPSVHIYEVNIPVGSRLAMRAQCQITDATDRLFDAIILGVG